jgi:hypothetical protein
MCFLMLVRRIPSRYNLQKGGSKDFREDQLEMVTPINQSGRSEDK